MTDTADLLVLGGGPAGIQASRMVKAAHPEWRVTMLRPEPASMIYCAIPYVLEGVVPPEKALKADTLVTGAGIELVREEAVAVDARARRVWISGGGELVADRLLLALGARPLVPDLPGVRLGRVETVKSQADMERILGHLAGGARRAVVVGAGAIGIEQAIAFRRRGLDVHLVDLADRVLPHMADADTSAPAKAILEDLGVELHLGSRLVEFLGEERVAGVRLSSGETLPLEEGSDFVVLALGMRPNVELLGDQLDLGPDGFVVDDRMRTSVPGVWAAGDCIQSVSGIDGKPLGGKLATNAVPQAKVAAADILGREARYPGIFNGVATVVGELRIGATGFTESWASKRGFAPVAAAAELTSRFPMMPGASPVRVKLVADGKAGRLLGGQVTGYEAVAERVDVITLALQRGMTAGELAGLSYSAQPWQTYFPANNPIVAAAAALAEKLEG